MPFWGVPWFGGEVGVGVCRGTAVGMQWGGKHSSVLLWSQHWRAFSSVRLEVLPVRLEVYPVLLECLECCTGTSRRCGRRWVAARRCGRRCVLEVVLQK